MELEYTENLNKISTKRNLDMYWRFVDNKKAFYKVSIDQLVKLLNEKNMESSFVVLPKKINAKQSSDYRTIGLMGPTLKAFLKVLDTRVYRKIEQDINETQFELTNGLGTREALYAVNIMSQRCLDINQHLYLCNYNKAFDKVREELRLKRS